MSLQQSQSRVSFPKSVRRARPGETMTGKSDAQRVISVSIIVKRKNALNLEALGGRHVSQAEFAEKYGADPSAFDQLRAFAHENGLAVDEGSSSLARRTIVMRGPIRKVEQAFGVTLNEYQREGKAYFSYEGAISMDQDYADLVEAVLGLDDHPAAQPHFRLYDKKKIVPALDSSFNPPQVAQLYGFPTDVTVKGQTIGIIELGGGYKPSDLSAYFTGLGIVAPKVTAVSVDGGTNSPGDPNGPDLEVALDIEVAGSIATGANIAVYFTPNTTRGFMDALTTALHDTANGPPSACGWSRRWPCSGTGMPTSPKGGGGCSGPSTWPPMTAERRWPTWRTGSACCWSGRASSRTRSGTSNAAWRSGVTSATGTSRPENSTASASPTTTSATWTPRDPCWRKAPPCPASSAVRCGWPRP